MLSNSEYYKEVVSKMTAEDQKTFIAKIKEWFEKIIDAIKKVMGRYDSKSAEYQLLARDAETLEGLQRSWDNMIKDSYKKLNNKELTQAERRKLISKIAKDYGVHRQFSNDSTKLSFGFSGNNLTESLSKQKAGLDDYAKMLSCFSDVIDNAIGIESHNRNKVGYKADPTLKQVYVLASAFVDRNRIVPVKLEVKEFNDKANTLYVAVSLEGIKTDGFPLVRDVKDVAQINPPSEITLASFFNKINKNDVNFLKYVPKQFFEDNSKSVSYSGKDSDGNILSLNQNKFFEKSKIRDKDGNLLLVYHGTPNSGFTVLSNLSKGGYADHTHFGHWFTDTKDAAKRFSDSGVTYDDNIKKIYEGYINAENPYVVDAHGKAWNDISVPQGVIDWKWDNATKSHKNDFRNIYYKGFSDEEIKKEVYGVLTTYDLSEYAYSKGYDAIVVENVKEFSSSDGIDVGYSITIFNPEQFKQTDNLNPTNNPDMQFSLKSPVESVGNLMVIHNMHESDLIKALKLGGFPMPSIAVMRADNAGQS